MKTQLKNISTIQSGIFAKPGSEGDVVYIQAKHFNENGNLRSVLHPDLKKSAISEKHLLKHGDVLFSSKGTKNFATWYEEDNLPAVASTSFFVIRIEGEKEKSILPEFLAWSINQPDAQKFLKGKAIGSTMASISKPSLEELELIMPKIKIQKEVLCLHNLLQKEKEIQTQINSLKEKIIKKQIFKAIND